jgi:uncharacterized protein involved in type VI secretion and phage assembly
MRLHGIHVAVVVARGDGNDDHRYRVRLALPWLGGDDTTRWARVAAVMAGGGRGCYALPAVGDQVVVAFERGDVDRPIVLGALWSSAQRRGEDGAGAPGTLAAVVSRAGHRIAFDDGSGGGVSIVDASGRNAVTLDGATGTIRISAAGDVTIRAARDVVATARAVAMAATTIAVRAGGEVRVAADASLAVTAGSRIAAVASHVTTGSHAGIDSSGAQP